MTEITKYEDNKKSLWQENNGFYDKMTNIHSITKENIKYRHYTLII